MEVPASTSARVYLPGKNEGPLEVGSGFHRWSYAYAPPAEALPALTLDSTLGDLIDHPAAYEAVMRLMAEHNPEFARRMEGQTAVTLRQAIRQNPRAAALAEKVEAVLG